jgi:hypothetical protein
MKSWLEPDDESPGLIRVLTPAVVFLTFGVSLHLATDLIIWVMSLMPSAILATPFIRYCCRMTWIHAALTASVTLIAHIIVLLTLNHFGYKLEFDPQLFFKDLWK